MSNFDGNIVTPSSWPDVPQLSAACVALGGVGGPMNAQALAIVARLGFLADAVAALDAGAALFTGSGAPANTVGKNGDIYIDIQGTALYGPKAAGTWPAATSLKGPAGNPGPAGSVGPAGGFTHPVVFNAAGTTTWTVPDGVTQLVLELWGAGGGGGRVAAADGNGNFFKGAGGAGGSYLKALVAVTPGQVLSLGVGAGGTGAGQTGNTSSDSGTSGGSTTVSIAGGGGWTAAAGGGAGASGTTGGSGGTASTTGTATVIESMSGQSGQHALIVTVTSGTSATYYSGSGGDGARGGTGGFGVHSYPNSAGDIATAGTFPGGAGAGADEQGLGGNGASGKAVIWY
jgi:hypothetical protein